MANWGATSTVSISANNISAIANSSLNIIRDNFSANQLPRIVKSGTLNAHPSINRNVGSVFIYALPYNDDSIGSLSYRNSISYSNAITYSYFDINKRPSRGHVYPR